MHEKQPAGERKGRIAGFLKKFNKVSAVVLASAGVIFESPLLLGLAAIDAGQAWAIGRYEKWRDRRKAAKDLGKTALQPA